MEIEVILKNSVGKEISIDLPTDSSDFDIDLDVLKSSKIVGVFVGDIEQNFADFYDTVEEVNELARQLGEESEEVIETMLDDFNILEVAEIVDSGDYTVHYDCTDVADVAAELVEECGWLNGLPKELRGYFDYEALGRDLSYDNTYIKSDYGFIVEVFNR